MAKKKGKSVSFDAMVKFFMHSYHIPTKRDIEGINARLERIERLLLTPAPASRRTAAKDPDKQNAETASGAVLAIIRRNPEGVGFSEIQVQTGFDEKKLRNILFRLHKLDKIKRKSRGVYLHA
ncbi:MAG: hypothetical protein HY911_08395 [Desulfobacterales bacterium]|nr:hypothetical protein [Desulfobacterales bacterium]MBI5894699.1 hypothetical protein [Desulfobacterales bacterium]